MAAIPDHELGAMIPALYIIPIPACPRCGVSMRLVIPHNLHTGKLFDPFWGCPNYPGCRETEDVEETAECPG